ncbi:hypothetical protein LZ198_32840 [Myxococcus sp. K15C18031901]|uniref:FlgO family outer membrane protein n=1 Tax=Myxococcus dinghuensis TaxID=2906761 RepID=UPI0020A77490|nr:FlgO family outer membrane protein [Myxococcus dinghuensis]MCP3103681.1 hypothetical protein [Myxococcus dinghuensis]
MSAWAWWTFLFALGLATGGQAAPPEKPREGPAAVMPFRNLNEDPALDWLGRGMTETLVSDLRASGLIQVVEREQLTSAIAELALQDLSPAKDSTALRVGRLVGARLLVLGSVQLAGKQVRINARFISVETGEVLDTAKVTGPLTRIFSLQDEVATRLLGTTPRQRPSRPSGESAVKALESFGRALGPHTDEERAVLLRKVLDDAPGFYYAQEEITRTQARLATYRLQATSLRKATRSKLRAMMEDATLRPLERSAAALQLLDHQQTRFNWRSGLQDTERVLELSLSPYQGRDPDEVASWYRALALSNLEQWDRANAAAEAYLQRFPESPNVTVMEMLLRTNAVRRADRERERKELLRDLQDLETTSARSIAELEAKKASTTEVRRERDWRRCFLPSTEHHADLAQPACRAYYETWGPGANPREQVLVRQARDSEITALIGLQRYKEARARLDAFRAVDPEGERDSFSRASVLAIQASDDD